MKGIKEELENKSENDIRKINMHLIEEFYIVPYSDEFYDDFYKRLSEYI